MKIGDRFVIKDHSDFFCRWFSPDKIYTIERLGSCYGCNSEIGCERLNITAHYLIPSCKIVVLEANDEDRG
jgi:hypothetical protein